MRDKIPASERSIELLELLTRYTGKSISYLSEYFNVDKRTIQRDIAKLKRAGYVIENIHGKYKINKELTKKEVKFKLSELIHFTKEEAFILNEAISNIEGNDVIKKNLVKKLSSLNNVDDLLESVSHLKGAEEIKTIAHAIENKYQVIVEEYAWSSINIRVRKLGIEPIQFASSYSRVWAYSEALEKNFLLRLSGIKNVKATYRPFKCEQYHKVGNIDVFKGYGFTEQKVKLRLNISGYGYLLEEYPLAVPHIEQINEGEYILETKIYNFNGVGRFCLSLPEDVMVIEPRELIEYLETKKSRKYNHRNSDQVVSKSIRSFPQ